VAQGTDSVSFRHGCGLRPRTPLGCLLILSLWNRPNIGLSNTHGQITGKRRVVVRIQTRPFVRGSLMNNGNTVIIARGVSLRALIYGRVGARTVPYQSLQVIGLLATQLLSCRRRLYLRTSLTILLDLDNNAAFYGRKLGDPGGC
jgi:hypothetical protein